MTTRSNVGVTLLLLVAIAGLGLTDAYMNRKDLAAYLPGNAEDATKPDTDVPSPVPIPVQQGPDVAASITALGFTTATTNEASLIEQIVQDASAVSDLGILSNGDRIGSVTWVTSANVKNTFIALKEALLPSFSTDVTDLKDTTDARPGHPVRNVLTFLDPALSTERMTFVRVAGNLYEFHIVTGKEAQMQTLIDALTVR